jgi:hypothetical protein
VSVTCSLPEPEKLHSIYRSTIGRRLKLITIEVSKSPEGSTRYATNVIEFEPDRLVAQSRAPLSVSHT